MKSITVELDHITLGGLSFGASDKPVLLALHGWLDNAASFIPLASYLQDYHIIAIEWPGHGHSNHRAAGASYHLADYVYDLYAISEYFKTEYQCTSLSIIAHSLGGIVASMFAGTFTEKVERLVLIESFGPMTAPAADCTSILKKSIVQKTREGTKPMPVHPTLASAINARANAGDVEHNTAKWLVERGSVAVAGGYTWRSDARLRTLSPIRLSEAQALQFFESITAPTLSILGEGTMLDTSEIIANRMSRVANLHTMRIAGGHHVHMEQPEKIAQAIGEFLKQ